MQAQHIIRQFRSIGVLAAVAWTASSVISFAASLSVCFELIPEATDDHAAVLAVAGTLGLGFAVGNYAIARALGEIANAVASEIANQDTRRKLGRA